MRLCTEIFLTNISTVNENISALEARRCQPTNRLICCTAQVATTSVEISNVYILQFPEVLLHEALISIFIFYLFYLNMRYTFHQQFTVGRTILYAI